MLTVADAVFHFEMSRLNASANTVLMLATDATFHLPMSSLKAGAELNSKYMSLTAAVFQSEMGPYVIDAVVGLETHAFTAGPMFPSVMAVKATAGDVLRRSRSGRTAPRVRDAALSECLVNVPMRRVTSQNATFEMGVGLVRMRALVLFCTQIE